MKCYREQIFVLFPMLKTLDGIDIKGEEIDDLVEGQQCSHNVVVHILSLLV